MLLSYVKHSACLYNPQRFDGIYSCLQLLDINLQFLIKEYTYMCVCVVRHCTSFKCSYHSYITVEHFIVLEPGTWLSACYVIGE